LIGGANKPLLALVSFVIFLPLLYLNNRLKKTTKIQSNKATLHIQGKKVKVETLSKLIAPHAQFLQLKRADYNQDKINASYYCLLTEPTSLDQIVSQLESLDASSVVTYVDQPDMLL